MNTMSSLSNAELLAYLVGPEKARVLAGKPLTELFGYVACGMREVRDETMEYVVHPAIASAKELVARCMEEQLGGGMDYLAAPNAVKSYLAARIGHLEHEAFWCLWLNSQNQLIVAEEMFRGTISQTSVYPREVVKRSMALNASAVIFAHNHPSGSSCPSGADQRLTSDLKKALALVDVRVLDHVVVSGAQSESFVERGLL